MRAKQSPSFQSIGRECRVPLFFRSLMMPHAYALKCGSCLGPISIEIPELHFSHCGAPSPCCVIFFHRGPALKHQTNTFERKMRGLCPSAFTFGQPSSTSRFYISKLACTLYAENGLPDAGGKNVGRKYCVDASCAFPACGPPILMKVLLVCPVVATFCLERTRPRQRHQTPDALSSRRLGACVT